MTTDEVLDALGRYTKDSKESDRQTATKLGIRCSVLGDWLRGRIQPEKCALARLAGVFETRWVFVERSCSVSGGSKRGGSRIAGSFSKEL